MVEAVKDIQFRVAPLNREQALEMISSVRGAELLNGYRGSHATDRGQVAEIILAVGDLLAGNSTIMEIEINPLISSKDGLIAVDARMNIG
jgi:hypothetical protein